MNAFIARGIDSQLANSLVQQKLTLSKLKLKKTSELIDLGIDSKIADIISKEQRPPIPEETVIKLLYQSKWTCCICRDVSKGVIIHHIKEWNISKDHSEENLVVLCPNHHDLAHTKKDLTLNLTESKLKEIKKEWLKEVSLQDTNTIRGLTIAEHTSGWDYFNHNRIFEIFLKKGISNRNFKTTLTGQRKGWINELGT
ncbi:HNH endonuclease signature motif containing protein [Tenacibaculum maritimum]|uniref:HNH endonuclease signature motif containing protein n=1 Tax=Tenacibaculum maritimum TaxID=107401 RepID=UPI0013305802|nr:HNH endonuclease signature motif containing protein [Tenacibaculum maritimum]